MGGGGGLSYVKWGTRKMQWEINMHHRPLGSLVLTTVTE